MFLTLLEQGVRVGGDGVMQLSGPVKSSVLVKCFSGPRGSGEGRRKCGTKFLVDINLLPLGGPRKLGRSGGEVTLLI